MILFPFPLGFTTDLPEKEQVRASVLEELQSRGQRETSSSGHARNGSAAEMEVAVQFLRKLSETWCELSELMQQGKYPGILAIHNGEDSVILSQGVH